MTKEEKSSALGNTDIITQRTRIYVTAWYTTTHDYHAIPLLLSQGMLLFRPL